MSFLDGILSQVTSNVDIKNLAAKVGISPEQAEAAVAALAKAHPEPGNTVDSAAASTGLDSGILSQIVGHIGGEGALGQFASMLGGAGDAEGGGIMDKLGGLAGGLFGGGKS
ncbi:hypothetical protein [Sphingomonas bacterium]|uniref:hypothetical protein n=1 Tax=Sphingomonas bacterium TaxID=1895847 RepID=UPI00262135BB|nr:hypothetical protein [Sphingomonas bacterium]MDB5678888.1 hypothetical protein [Sphingomonas bacterium]